MTSKSANRAVLSVKWSVLAVISLLLNVATISGIVVLALVQHADALATVALALAVLAFVGQLVIFVWQTAQGNSLLELARELNRSTLELIGDAKTRIDSTYNMVQSQYNELLTLTSLKSQSSAEGAVGDVHGGSLGSTAPPNEAESAGVNSEAAQIAAEPYDDNPLAAAPTAEEKAHIGVLLTWPEDIAVVEAAIKELRALTTHVLANLIFNLAAETIWVTGVAGARGIALGPLDARLIEAGLCVEVEPKTRAGVITRQVGVTPHGVEVSRVLTADWPPPLYVEPIKEQVWELRSTLTPDAQESVKELRVRVSRLVG